MLVFLCLFAESELRNVEPHARSVQLNGARCGPPSSRREPELKKGR